MPFTPLRSIIALTLLSTFIGCAPTPATPATAPVADAALPVPPPMTTPMTPPAPPSSAAHSSAPAPVAMSVASTAPAVLPPELKFSAESIRAIQTGSKTATVRKGTRSFPNGVIKAVSTNSDAMILTNVVTTSKKVSELTEADAKVNGSGSLDELKADLDRDYPGIEPDDVVTVITFRPSPVDPAK